MSLQRIETLLKHDMGSKFDTRKTLNRSNVQVSDTILEQIESGSFTCEMIDALAKQFPIFRYQTQITIHGEFDVTNSRIGGYKNVFQNGNLSLGIKYSAIDTVKIELIRTMLNKVQVRGAGMDIKYFNFYQNSTTRLFRRSQRIYKDNFDTLKAEFIALSERIKEVSIYGFVDCYIMPTLYSGHEIILDVHPLAIPTDKVNELVYALLDVTEENYNEMAEAADKKRAEEKRISEAAELERREKVVAKQARKKEFCVPLKAAGGFTEPVDLSMENPIVCKFNIVDGVEPEFVFMNYVFYRLMDKGAFGKHKIFKGTSLTANYNDIMWEEEPYKTMKIADIKIKGYAVSIEKKVVPAVKDIKPLPSEKTSTVKATGVYIADYSEKAIAVLGDTKPFKEILGKNGLGGSFNFALTVNGEKVCGWIFPKKRLDEVTEKLGL